MNHWPTVPASGIAPLPPGLKIAGMGTRLGAWLVDSLILGGFQMGFLMLAVAVGALSVNPEAERQIQAAPLTMPTVPPYQANLPLLAAMLAVFVALVVVYASFFWASYRGLPGQRLFSLQVGSAATGRNLSVRSALLRALVSVGIPFGAFAGVLYGVFAFETSVPWSDVVSQSPGGPAEAWMSTPSGLLLTVAMLLMATWPVLLLIWTAASQTRQGPHDRLAGSLVVGKAATRWAGAGQRPGYPPAFGPGYGPGYGPGFVLPFGMPVPGSPAAMDASPRPSADGESTDPNADQDAPGTSDAPAGSPGSQPGMPLPPGASPWSWPGSWAGPGGDGSTQPPGSDGGPLWLQSGPEPSGPPKAHPATVGRRAAGYLFDCVIVYMSFSLVATLITAAFLPSTATAMDERTYILIGLVGGFMQLAYFTSGWAVWRGTLGQKLMHMSVTEATTGKALGWMDAIVRWAIIQGPFALVTIVPEAIRVIVLFAAMSWAMYLLYTTTTNPDLRGLHDRFLNSQVSLDL